jgi:hypothetical protein
MNPLGVPNDRRHLHNRPGFVVGVLALLAVGAFIAVPGLLPACCGGPEAQVIGMLRAINSGEAAYSSACAGGGFAQTLDDLVRAPDGGTGFFSVTAPTEMVRPRVGGPVSLRVGNTRTSRGYVVTLRAEPSATTVTPAARTCNGSVADAVSAYFAEAHPVGPADEYTHRTFATDARGTIYEDKSGTPIQPGMAGASPVQ